MFSIIRLSHLATLPALLLAFGCASTSTPAPTSPEPSAPISEMKDPNETTIRDASSATLVPVYFETDRALLLPEARDALKRYAESILDHPEWGALTIDGHCDERGSQEYNLALGRRRAAVVERYLMDMGVPRSRLAARTFGEEKPAVVGHNEGAWRYNRRSEFQVEALESASR
jgi:peptidoglycan-associated lipoprotein